MNFGAAGRSSWRSARNARVQLLDVNIRRCGSNQTTQQDKAAKRSPLRPEPSSTHDWIGPPNPLSNLRPIIYRIPEEESELEKRLRNLRQDTEDWNHKFWTKQNLNFSKEKEAFIVSQLSVKGLTLRDADGRRRSLSSEEMAVFYKSFLDKNRIRHANYNKEWYRRNFTITLLMARVVLSSTWRTFTERWNSKKSGSPTL
ncbi:Apoptogenic protein 1, mitochondrial [Oryzias melastigma]|uniref:Apoptogenic protein 1, mitochondrial n=2 Tax=Oryzias melastigma TaxID=30732 RepID=A0A3B3C5F2_ORYME|nr:cytochrome c oxidase assembly factor 8 [Oryzias melastigma]KAF6716651.1 Apoptogenic protein 1, mitochondrial [Oryzias melastigma]